MERLRWGLVGCGDIARKRVAPALGETGELIAVARADYARAAEFAREFDARRWYRTWEELLGDDEIEAVYVAAPVDLHAPVALAAAAAGKHVLCEKPLALDAAESARMIAACQAAGVRLGVAYYRRFYPVVRRLKEMLEAGAIGRTVVAQANAFEWFDPPPGHPRRWLLEKTHSGGGPMFDFGCHRVEVLLHLCGAVRDVRASVGRALFQDREVEDTAVAVLEFAGGARGVLTVTHAAREPQDTLDLFGDAGSLHIPVLNRGRLRHVTPHGENFEEHPPDANLHRPLIADFGRAVREGREPEVDGRVGLEVARVMAEIYERGAAVSEV